MVFNESNIILFLPMYNRKKQIVGFTKISFSDKDKIYGLSFSKVKRGNLYYATTSIKKRFIILF